VAKASRIYLEVGKQWVFACAIEWPGWCRRATGEQAAVAALLDYASRYREVAGPGFSAGEVEIVGRLDGNATTDFGAPSVSGPWDETPLVGAHGKRLITLLEACWRAFDAVVAGAPATLRKGPRGGGRDRDQIVDHVRDAERAYSRKIGLRVLQGTPWDEQRVTIVAALSSPLADDGVGPATGWTPRYALRRIAWHVLDHAWEIEDKSQD
jgi:hypothetical protein